MHDRQDPRTAVNEGSMTSVSGARVSGDLALMPAEDVVLWCANRKHTGVLTLRMGDVDKTFVVRNGALVQAASSDPRAYLGQHLINFGYINETQLQMAWETQVETKVPLGRILVMVDAIDNEKLEKALLFKLREGLLEALFWSEGQFAISDEVKDTELDAPLAIDLFEIHSEFRARSALWNDIQRVFPTPATRCMVKGAVDDGPTPFDRSLLGLLSRGYSIAECALELRCMDFPLYARLFDLHGRGLVAPVAPSDDIVIEDDLGGGETIELDLDADAISQMESVLAAEHDDPAGALRVALAGRNWQDALTFAQRILEKDPHNSEALAGQRVAHVQIRRAREDAGDIQLDLRAVPKLTMLRSQIPTADFTSRERYVLSRLDGARSLQQIIAVSPIKEDELRRIIIGFWRRGLVVLEET